MVVTTNMEVTSRSILVVLLAALLTDELWMLLDLISPEPRIIRYTIRLFNTMIVKEGMKLYKQRSINGQTPKRKVSIDSSADQQYSNLGLSAR